MNSREQIKFIKRKLNRQTDILDKHTDRQIDIDKHTDIDR